MCGIAGFVSPSGNLKTETLHKMVDALRHRGPDAEGFWEEDFVALGHRRLSIIDLSDAANQPMQSHCGRYSMVFNGEIYNYKEVAEELKKAGGATAFKTNSDSEVLLQSFVQWGPDCVLRFNGMFAIAIWDRQEKELFLCRDRMGIKPVYYWQMGEDLSFASELKSLLQLPYDKQVDKESLQDYLFLEYVPLNRSIIQGVKKLQNGHFLKWKDGKIQIHQYYDLLEKINPSEGNLDQWKEKFLEAFRQSVRYRSISDVPIGAFLSGGTDSSLVCSVFQEQNEDPVNTFTIGFDVASYDESKYASRVARLLDTEHRETLATEKESLSMVDGLVDAYDEPFATPSTLPSLLVCKKAKEYVTVALSGDGGDELFMGYGHYFWQQRIQKIASVGGTAALRSFAALLRMGRNREKRAARVFDYNNLAKIWPHIWSQEQYMFNEKEISKMLGSTYQHQSLHADWDRIDKLDIHPFEKISLFDLRHYLAQNLLYKMDIASMNSSLEVRVPFLDHNVVETALQIPYRYKIHDGNQKYLLKKTLEEYLPDDLIYRKKWGFPAPLEVWLKKDLAHLIDHYLDPALLAKQALFDPAFVTSMVKAYRTGKDYHHKRIWALIVFQMWYEKYLGKL